MIKLIKRIKSTDYFFFISPIHFKISAKHQDIPFVIILKFNGSESAGGHGISSYKELSNIFFNLSFAG